MLRERTMLIGVALAILAIALGCNSGTRPDHLGILGSPGPGSTGGQTGSTGGSGGATGGGQPGSTNLSMVQAASMTAARGLIQAVRLDTGNVFAFGALMDVGQGQVSFAFDGEVYDPIADTWVSTAQMSQNGIRMNPNKQMPGIGTPNNAAIVGAFDYYLVKLPNGQVLMGGGLGFDELDPQGNPIYRDLDIAHVWDPQTGDFTLVPGTMNQGRVASTATLLPNGQVLIAGGYNTTTSGGQLGIGDSIAACDIYDPSSNSFLPASQTPTLQGGRSFQLQFPISAGALIHGLLQFQGGNTAVANPATMVFDQSNSTWRPGNPMAEERYYHAGVAMANGNILVVGGQGVNTQTGAQQQTATAEMYEQSGNSWRRVGQMQAGRVKPAMAELGNTGDVLVIGGIDQQTSGQTTTGVALDTIEMWSATANDFIAAFQLPASRSAHGAVTLQDGRILVIGGFTGGGAQDPVDGTDGTPLADCLILQR